MRGMRASIPPSAIQAHLRSVIARFPQETVGFSPHAIQTCERDKEANLAQRGVGFSPFANKTLAQLASDFPKMEAKTARTKFARHSVFGKKGTPGSKND